MNTKDDVTVKIKHLGELETVTFKVAESTSLQELWDLGYKKLTIDHKDGDVFQCKFKSNAEDLTPHLNLTLAEAIDQKICPNRNFEIAPGTGGANSNGRG